MEWGDDRRSKRYLFWIKVVTGLSFVGVDCTCWLCLFVLNEYNVIYLMPPLPEFVNKCAYQSQSAALLQDSVIGGKSGVTCRNTRALRKGKKSKVRVVVQSLRKEHMGNANGIDSEGVTSNWGS